MTLFSFELKPLTLSVALSLVFLSGCATTKPDPDPWLMDKPLIVQSLQDVHVGGAKLHDRLDALDQRVVNLERVNSEQATKIVMLESAMQRNMQLKEKAEKKAKKVLSLKPKPSLNQRLDALSATVEPKVTPVEPVQLKVIPQTPAQVSDEKNAYTAAYLAFKSARYDEASSRFVKVIKAHPKGEYTDQAYYWLGESLAALLRNDEALESFTVVANQYPNSSKHAASLFKIASVYKSMKYYDQARKTLQRVMKNYPDGRMIERARAELKSLPESNGAIK
ncbi:MAG: tetratricopeptide repeat protein [Ghiorsea sp.]|nr:tetratricopeptide repeat protein [Ghiorsea sp.]